MLSILIEKLVSLSCLIQFVLSATFKNLLNSCGMKFTCNAPESNTPKIIKNSKPSGQKYQTYNFSIGALSVQHCNLLQALFYQNGIFAPEELSKFGIFCQKSTLGCLMKLSIDFCTEIPLQTAYFNGGIFVPFLKWNILHKKCSKL